MLWPGSDERNGCVASRERSKYLRKNNLDREKDAADAILARLWELYQHHWAKSIRRLLFSFAKLGFFLGHYRGATAAARTIGSALTSTVRWTHQPSPRLVHAWRRFHHAKDMAQDLVIEARRLRKSYRSTVAVDGLDLEMKRGEVLSLLGPNGAGKTTTVEVLEGYRRRDAGDAKVLGEDPQRAGAACRARRGVVLQECEDVVDLTVSECVRHFSSPVGASRGALRGTGPQEALPVRRSTPAQFVQPSV